MREEHDLDRIIEEEFAQAELEQVRSLEDLYLWEFEPQYLGEQETIDERGDYTAEFNMEEQYVFRPGMKEVTEAIEKASVVDKAKESTVTITKIPPKSIEVNEETEIRLTLSELRKAVEEEEFPLDTAKVVFVKVL